MSKEKGLPPGDDFELRSREARIGLIKAQVVEYVDKYVRTPGLVKDEEKFLQAVHTQGILVPKEAYIAEYVFESVKYTLEISGVTMSEEEAEIAKNAISEELGKVAMSKELEERAKAEIAPFVTKEKAKEIATKFNITPIECLRTKKPEFVKPFITKLRTEKNSMVSFNFKIHKPRLIALAEYACSELAEEMKRENS